MRQGAETLGDRWTGQKTQTGCLCYEQCAGRWECPSKGKKIKINKSVAQML